MLCLFIIELVELGEVVPEDLNAIFEGKCSGEVKGLSLPRHRLRLLVLVVDILVRSEGLVAVLLDFLDLLLHLVASLLVSVLVLFLV